MSSDFVFWDSCCDRRVLNRMVTTDGSDTSRANGSTIGEHLEACDAILENNRDHPLAWKTVPYHTLHKAQTFVSKRRASSLALTTSLGELAVLCARPLTSHREDLTEELPTAFESRERISSYQEYRHGVQFLLHSARVHFLRTWISIPSVVRHRDDQNATSEVLDHEQVYQFPPPLRLLPCSRFSGNQGWLISKSPEEMTCLDFLGAAIGILLDIRPRHLTNVSDRFPTSLRFSDAVLCF